MSVAKTRSEHPRIMLRIFMVCRRSPKIEGKWLSDTGQMAKHFTVLIAVRKSGDIDNFFQVLNNVTRDFLKGITVQEPSAHGQALQKTCVLH